MGWRREHEADVPPTRGAMAAVVTASLAVGFLLGVMTASGAFFYDGTGRVNVLVVLALFVALPLATLALLAVAGSSRHGPRGLNPGRLGAAMGRIMPSPGPRALAGLAAGERGPDVSRWLLLTWSQWIALGFGAGAVCAALALVVFTDLAFGWSTTLEADGTTVHALVSALALPWRGWLPGAVPSAELVEASRYFRLAGDTAAVADALRLGGWWRFVVMCMLVYATLPRIVTVVVCHRRLSRACGEALLADPRVHALVERMVTPVVETRADEAEVHAASAAGDVAFEALPAADAWHLVNWAAVPVETAAVASLLAPARLLDARAAGGTRGVAADRALARELASLPARTGVLVVARGFDPPSLDLMDFLAELRDAVPPGSPVAVLPIAIADGAPAPLAPAHATAWASALARHAVEGVQPVAVGRSAAA